MKYTPSRVIELLSNITWRSDSVLRILWVRHSEGSRDQFAEQLPRTIGIEGIIPLVVRGNVFFNPNAILSDVLRLFTENQSVFEDHYEETVQRFSVILLGKSDFQLPQGSSPITLPSWFPVWPGRETFFDISDLAMSAEVALLDCPEARIEQIAEFTHKLEAAIVARLFAMQSSGIEKVQKFVDTAHGGGAVPNCAACVADYQTELDQSVNPRAYRPNAAKEAKSLISRLLKLVLNNSPKQLSTIAQSFAECFGKSSNIRLKPTLFAVMLRPASKMGADAANWHAIMLAFYQAYQLMNSAAHAGEYPHYSVSLQFVSSVDLRSFLSEACQYVDGLE